MARILPFKQTNTIFCKNLIQFYATTGFTDCDTSEIEYVSITSHCCSLVSKLLTEAYLADHLTTFLTKGMRQMKRAFQAPRQNKKITMYTVRKKNKNKIS